MSLALTSRRAALLPGRWVSNELWRRARAVPSLDLRFAENKSLVDSVSGQNLITFTRASTGTYVDSNGVIRSAANDAPRFDHNPTTGESLGLLIEEQRTNLLLNSETLSTQTVTVTAVAHTLSFYGTGTITLSGTSTAGPLVGTAANSRVSLTFTPTAGSLTLTVSGSVTNANLEIGSCPTSWIPTTGTAATRTVDVATITGSNFSSWYRQDEGAMLMGFRTIADDPGIFSVSDGGFNNRHQSYMSNSSLIVRTSALGVASNNGLGAVLLNQNNKAVFAFSPGTTSGSLNGNLNTTTQAIPSNLNVAYFGASATGVVNNPVTLQRITFWPQRLPSSTLQSITQ